MGKFRAIAEGFRKASPESISGITRDSLKAEHGEPYPVKMLWENDNRTIGNDYNPWGDAHLPPLTEREIRKAQRSGAREGRQFSHQPDEAQASWSNMDHANRIATLMADGWNDPILARRGGGEPRILEDGSVYNAPRVVDGRHRLAAAYMRGDKDINLKWVDDGTSDMEALGRGAREGALAAEKDAIRNSKGGLQRIIDDPDTRALSDDINRAEMFDRGPFGMSYLHKGDRTNIFDIETDSAARGQGHARAGLSEFLAGQDAAGRSTHLTASPTDRTTTQTGLDQFYASLGFRPHPDDPEGFALMRPPSRQASWDALDGTIGNRDLYTRGNTPAVRGKWDTGKQEAIDGLRREPSEEARAQGFDIGPVYSARNAKDGIQGRVSQEGRWGPMVYASERPNYWWEGLKDAKDIPEGAVNVPMYMRGPMQSFEDFQKAGFDQEQAKALGFRGVHDPASGDVGVFDAKDRRGQFAAFDPAKRDSSDLLASALLGGGTALGAYAAGGQGDADAMNIGPMAKTWKHGAHEAALALEKTGAAPDAIWKQTGTFRGADGKWRQEIDDSLARFTGDTTQPYDGALGDFLKHDDLFAAYPEMKSLGFRYDPRGRGGGALPGEHLFARGERDALSTTLHEGQHEIQRKEGFAEGTNPFLAGQQYPDINKPMIDMQAARYAAAEPKKWWGAAAQKDSQRQRAAMDVGNDLYWNSAGEMEARDVQWRKDWSPERRASEMPQTSMRDGPPALEPRFAGVSRRAPYALPAAALAGGAAYSAGSDNADAATPGRRFPAPIGAQQVDQPFTRNDRFDSLPEKAAQFAKDAGGSIVNDFRRDPVGAGLSWLDPTWFGVDALRDNIDDIKTTTRAIQRDDQSAKDMTDAQYADDFVRRFRPQKKDGLSDALLKKRKH